MKCFTTPSGMLFERLLFVLYGRTMSDETGQNISRVSNHDDWNKEEKKQVKDWGVAFKLDDCNAGDSQSFRKNSTVGRCNKLRETSEYLFGP
jgi:hypothetical protein